MFTLIQFIFLLLPLVLFVFWLWMLWEMLHNKNLPSCFISFTNGLHTQFDWSVLFVLFNVMTAIVYFFTVYKAK